MAKRTGARPAAATATANSERPPRTSVPAFGGWEVAAGGAAADAAAAPDYSLDFATIRAARMQRRKTLSWSSFVGNAAVAEAEAPGGSGADEEEEKRRQWSSAAAASDGDDGGDERRRGRHRHRRLRSDGIDDDGSADDRQPIRPGRAAPKGRSKFKGYLFGCVAG